jgi:hypothetical protein
MPLIVRNKMILGINPCLNFSNETNKITITIYPNNERVELVITGMLSGII